MKKIIRRYLTLGLLSIVGCVHICGLYVSAQDQPRFDSVLDRTIDPIKTNLDPAQVGQGPEAINEFIINIIMNVVIPLVFIVSLLVIILGFYTLMFGEDDDHIKKGTKYIIWAVIGIVVIMSARYLATTVFEDLLFKGDAQTISGIESSDILYSNIIYPFLKMGIYLVLGFLFILLTTRVFSFVLSPSDDIRKQSTTMIVWNVIAMLIILGAKQIVELVYGKKEEVLNPADTSTLGNIGQGVLGNDSIPILYQAINWILGLATFIILIIIILQTYQLLTNPDDADQLTKIKRSFIYIFIGVFVIGAAYLITNVLIIN